MHKLKEKATVSNVLYTVVMAVLLLVLISPDAKSLMIQGMMKVGLFQPDVPADSRAVKGADKRAEVAPEAAFKNGAGETVKISDLKGKVVFINFWATWCPPCRAEMPTIEKLYDQFKGNKDIVFLIVNADEDFSKAAQYMQDNDYEMPVYTPAGNIPYAYLSGVLPTTVMINKDGEMVFRHAGAADYSDPKMVDFIKKLIAGEV